MATLLLEGLPPKSVAHLYDNLYSNRQKTGTKLLVRTLIIASDGSIKVDNLKDSNYSLIFTNQKYSKYNKNSIDVGERSKFISGYNFDISKNVIIYDYNTGVENSIAYINLYWNHNISTPFAKYYIYRNLVEIVFGDDIVEIESNDELIYIIEDPKATQVHLNLVEATVTYKFKIKAVNDDGNFVGQSNIIRVEIPLIYEYTINNALMFSTVMSGVLSTFNEEFNNEFTS